jgi:hypothetical protein
MQRKLKLAKLILIEAEGLEEAKEISSKLNLAEELHKDAVELAKLIQQEEENKEAV